MIPQDSCHVWNPSLDFPPHNVVFTPCFSGNHNFACLWETHTLPAEHRSRNLQCYVSDMPSLFVCIKGNTSSGFSRQGTFRFAQTIKAVNDFFITDNMKRLVQIKDDCLSSLKVCQIRSYTSIYPSSRNAQQL